MYSRFLLRGYYFAVFVSRFLLRGYCLRGYCIRDYHRLRSSQLKDDLCFLDFVDIKYMSGRISPSNVERNCYRNLQSLAVPK
jgi:hypothetical protein